MSTAAPCKRTYKLP